MISTTSLYQTYILLLKSARPALCCWNLKLYQYLTVSCIFQHCKSTIQLRSIYHWSIIIRAIIDSTWPFVDMSTLLETSTNEIFYILVYWPDPFGWDIMKAIKTPCYRYCLSSSSTLCSPAQLQQFLLLIFTHIWPLLLIEIIWRKCKMSSCQEENP